MSKDKKTKVKKLRDLTPAKDAKGGVRKQGTGARPRYGIPLPPIPAQEK